jgi:FKBP-type peptidyl-prolyl cis-trans isomerase
MYVGKFLDGKVFDQSKQPIDMPIGQMIPGFNEALTLMKKGGKATFVILQQSVMANKDKAQSQATLLWYSRLK